MSYSKFLDEVNAFYENNESRHFSSEEAHRIVRDKWIDAGRYDELTAYILENWDSGNCDEFAGPFLQHLINKAKDASRYKRLMKGIIRIRMNKLWEAVKCLANQYHLNKTKDIPRYKRLIKGITNIKTNGVFESVKDLLKPSINWQIIDKIDVSTFKMHSNSEYSDIRRVVAFQRSFALDALRQFRDGLSQLGDEKEIYKIDKMIQDVSTLNKPKPQKSSDTRKIDDTLFWEIIEKARQETEDKYEFLDKLKSNLESFKPSEIRKFAKLLLSYGNKLHTWEHWALAYIARRGCGDDEFDYFKAWAVSKGKAAYNTILEIRENEIRDVFDEDPQFEQMLYIAEEAYENKTGGIMPVVKVKMPKISGRNWEEQELKELFPSICKIFDYQ